MWVREKCMKIKFWVQKYFFLYLKKAFKKILGPKQFWVRKKMLGLKNFWVQKKFEFENYFWSNKISGLKTLGKCQQGICCLDKCHHNSWHLLNMVPTSYLKSLVKIESVTTEIFLLWTNVTRTNVACDSWLTESGWYIECLCKISVS